MPLIITCPEADCRRQLRVPDELLGQGVKCPRCGKVFTAREDAPPAAVAPAPLPPHPDNRPPPERPDAWEDLHDGDDSEDDYDRPRRRRRRDYVPHRGGSILTLGILSLLCLGFIFGPIAWSMGSTDLQEIRAGRMDPEGEGTTNAGRICGIIGTILGVVHLLCCFLRFAALSGRGRF
jgi:predicted Zn finger-like uncharacterized protein